MSGFVRNDWGQYLNGGSSYYNFEYRSRALLEPTPAPAPPPSLAPVPITPQTRKNNKEGRVVIPAQKGGKIKSLRSKRSNKRSNKNKRRRTHRK
jgi:hypothetical protein